MNQDNLKKLEEFMFPVVKMPLLINNEKTGLIGIFEEYMIPSEYDMPGNLANVNPKECLGHHSKDYVLITNEELIKSALVIIEEMGLTIKKIDTNWSWTNKKRMFVSIVTDSYFSINGEDEHYLTLNLYNSYDGTMTFGVDFGTYRMICSNGMYVGTQIMSTRKKHYLEFDPIIIKHQIVDAIEKFPGLQKIYQSLMSKELATLEINEMLLNARKRCLLTKEELILISGQIEIEQERNAYKIYNIFTFLSSHIIKTSFDRKVKLNNYIFNKLMKGK